MVQEKKEIANEIYKRLSKLYPNAKCTLNYRSPFELLIMTIMASQCTDERVNLVCKGLFEKLKTPHDFAKVSQKTLEKLIRPVGFYRNKAKCIIEASKLIVKQYGGEVPNRMEELLKLPGVGRKTANVILGECFNTPGIIVDTHCKRVSKRLGLTSSDNPLKIEIDLMHLLPREKWTFFSHLLVFHGRKVCKAKKPTCSECILADICKYYYEKSGE
ncbi:MAG: endonuclease III [Candidatus Hydrogenedentes bacterium]|nr:endonuclease III [Candidatus Hydrogenedentota bacterium]